MNDKAQQLKQSFNNNKNNSVEIAQRNNQEIKKNIN
jgi:hypothetical protein